MVLINGIDELIARLTAQEVETIELVNAAKASHPLLIEGALRLSDSDPRIVAEAKLSGFHDKDPFAPRPQKLNGSNGFVDVGDCGECDEAVFLVRDKTTGRTRPRCRTCYNAIMRQSLHHRQYFISKDVTKWVDTDEICLNCEITRDSLGLINGATHHSVTPIADKTSPDERIRIGLKSYIAANKLELVDGILYKNPI